MDIIERLRWRIHTSHDVNALTNEAADEIERLREALKNIGERSSSDDSWLSRIVDIKTMVSNALDEK